MSVYPVIGHNRAEPHSLAPFAQVQGADITYPASVAAKAQSGGFPQGDAVPAQESVQP